ncbi:MAG: NADH-quinone oxidoreductase subunit [Eubacteriales bacterium]|nr:NADH-quinone oxidoreductase subunit [Eubacteriales bacterium]
MEKKVFIADLIAKYRAKRGGLIPLLQEVQERIGYLPRWALEEVAQGLDLSLAKVVGVATFYSFFRLKPKGRNIIRICTGTACHVRGAEKVMAAVKEELEIGPGETTADGEFSVETVACIGACGLAPLMTINDEVYGRLTREEVVRILRELEAKEEVKV